MLQFINVSKRYLDSGEVLSNISFRLEQGEMAFLTGHSGAGKSTMLKLIPLIERPTRGQVLFEGKPINHLPKRQVPYLRRKLGLIFQDYRLLHDRTVFDNVALPLQIAGYGQQETARRVRAALDKVGLLRKEKRYPLALSGGEQQRVGIARAIVHKPSLILADEPTGNLDPELSAEIMELFREFNQVGVTLLIASHNLDLISRFACRNLKLHQGRLVEGG
ncbi:cell division ATP-binding protein FtsE [Methylocaldum szegediense]|jgi:cell division transport system ATP-binding protein|uniref:Cell division ATP-binding protein FtsE n=1 Tax=Methylocaldum szegediense TaxID=73780 RepID=A0ABM9I473_9GAMM|nr:cell division ATP-binding protein FtsE [Methylocaldum szegediense]CAI8881712.1 cell division protein FtsE [Methylocaldum szegediense]